MLLLAQTLTPWCAPPFAKRCYNATLSYPAAAAAAAATAAAAAVAATAATPTPSHVLLLLLLLLLLLQLTPPLGFYYSLLQLSPSCKLPPSQSAVLPYPATVATAAHLQMLLLLLL